MRYKTLPLQECRRLAREQLAGETGIGMVAVTVGDGHDLDMKPIRQAAKRIVRLIDDKATDRDRVEGRAAVLLYDGLAGVPFDALDDPGFWRYLSVGLDFWEFIAWREHGARKKGDKFFLKYVDGKRPTECVLPRMYMRVLALGARNDPKEQFRELATALPSATDFWRSHVVRVQTAASPAVVRAFARMQRDRRLKTEDLRKFAREISKIRSTVVLSTYDDEEADTFIRGLREKFDGRKAEQ